MIKKGILYIFRKARSPFKALKIAIKNKLGWLGVPVIIPYNAYGTENKIMVTGAVIEDKGMAKPEPDHKLWKNILTMVKRYSGDEIAGISLKVNYREKEYILKTNEKGLFHTILPRDPSVSEGADDTIKFSLTDSLDDKNDGYNDPVTAECIPFIVSPESDYLVVSDIDDTILVSHSTKTLKKLRVMMSKNALTRSPFEGVSALYRALNHSNETGERPIFYVSGSEWNLYDLLVDFFKDKQIPAGPLLLSDAKLSLLSLFQSGKKYQNKIEKIQDLFEHYYRHSFILIGDSGQKDPEIYLKMAEMYPSRVKAIYIRYIGSKKRNKRLERLLEEAREAGTEMIPVRTSTEAALHAVEKGFISADHIKKISEAKQLEEEQPE